MYMNPDGSMPAALDPSTNITFDQINALFAYTGGGPYLGKDNGALAVIENPQFVYDPTGSYGPYAFFVSLGTYSQTTAYHTVEAHANGTVGGHPGGPTVIDSALVTPQQFDNPGGLSTLLDSAAGNFFVFAVGIPPDRPAYWEPPAS
jgi:hypothetical protein